MDRRIRVDPVLDDELYLAAADFSVNTITSEIGKRNLRTEYDQPGGLVVLKPDLARCPVRAALPARDRNEIESVCQA